MGDDEQNNSGGRFGVMMKKLKPYLLVVSLQFGSAGMYIISMATLNHGMNRYVLIVYRNATAALVLAPFALVLERKTRPKMTISTFLHIMVLGFLEPVIDQGFTYLGMKYTSASFASAIMNAVPSVTFVIAVIFRVETVKIKEVRSQAKVIGTLVTFAGALLMTLYKGPVIDLLWSHKTSSHHESSSTTINSNQHWIAGTLFILLGSVAWSCFYVLQSITVKKYPANISLSCFICLAGALQGSAVAFTVERRPSAWAVGWDSRLLAPLYTGIISSGITYYVQGLVMKTRGPVFVTAFNPLCMIIVSILGSIILAEKLHLGSIIGGMVIAFGLYSVVWGKSKDYGTNPAVQSNTTVKDEAQELPITNANAISGAKLVIDKNSIDQPSQMQLKTVQI
ncbi:WAT1-related protein [Pyrus ussuriensis x Pyrus communis]|uniref:WAT1-related protein n=1 Tax=Pyrus ussuriensis x Pyrus communis TaxID=2448454 RepID=A0A5N5HUA2_9ROSA|nr:WAT1-related protein [Pyrus ussuriensis x Pyrus communis]